MTYNLLQKKRQEYQPPLPAILKNLKGVTLVKGKAMRAAPEIAKLFPHTHNQPLLKTGKGSLPSAPLRIGVVFSGGQAAGGHNVIAGLFDALKALHPKSRLFGFLNGPGGIIGGKQKEITKELLAPYRNQGGFDLIGSGRGKIETEEQMQAALKTCKELDGLVIIGGDDSNTNAAVLAEYFLANGCKTKVVGVPKTIDGDLKNAHVAISFGFDTACKTYAEMISNIARDCMSAKKYYHFIKLMGRSASHITLECALLAQPNLALIGEEIAAKKISLAKIVDEIVDLIIERAEVGKNYGVILIPEGLVEFIPEMALLLSELNKNPDTSKLSSKSARCFQLLPEAIQKQLNFERDPHGNVNLSLIETERMLIELVTRALTIKKKQDKFSAQPHFFGYEGRAGFPSNFDAHYCYALGYVAALIVRAGFTGYMSAVDGLSRPVDKWSVAAVPLAALLKLEVRKGKTKPVIEKALVDLKGEPFTRFAKKRNSWQIEDEYRFVGPIQFFGDTALIDATPISLC